MPYYVVAKKTCTCKQGRAGKRAETKVDRAVVARDDLSAFEGSVIFDLIDPATRSINIGSLGVSVGLGDLLGGMGDQDTVATRQTPPTRTTGSGKFADNAFKKVVASFSRIQTLYDNLSAILRLEGQWSSLHSYLHRAVSHRWAQQSAGLPAIGIPDGYGVFWLGRV